VDAGWYIDPNEEGSGRYHDGTAWTASTVAIPPGKTLPRVPGTSAPQPPAAPSSIPQPAPRAGSTGTGVVHAPQSHPTTPRPAPSRRPNPPGAPADRTTSATAEPPAASTAADRGPSTGGAQLQKQPKPTQNRQRLLVLVGVLVVVIGAAVLVFVLKHPNDQAAQVEGLNRSRTTLPLSSAPCRLAMTQQLAAGATPPGGIPGALLSCTPQQWVSAYRGAAEELGQTNVDSQAALRAACLPYQSGGTDPQACSGVSPPTSGP
jgi:hypothetical protein